MGSGYLVLGPRRTVVVDVDGTTGASPNGVTIPLAGVGQPGGNVPSTGVIGATVAAADPSRVANRGVDIEGTGRTGGGDERGTTIRTGYER